MPRTKNSGRVAADKKAAWLRHQAENQQRANAQKKAGQTDQQLTQQKLRKVLTELGQQLVLREARLRRLAPAFADRCWRVVELKRELRGEWERAERAEARIRELETQLAAVKKTNGNTPTARRPQTG
jgi:hypothetical protein